MGASIFVGCAMTVICLGIQCVVVTVLLRLLFRWRKRGTDNPSVTRIWVILTGALLILFAGNLLQIIVWAGLFLACGEFHDFETAFYHSTVNFSTLGYGDLVMSESHRTLGALEAVNGVLMLGLTTSVLFLVLNMLLRQGWQRLEEDA